MNSWLRDASSWVDVWAKTNRTTDVLTSMNQSAELILGPVDTLFQMNLAGHLGKCQSVGCGPSRW